MKEKGHYQVMSSILDNDNKVSATKKLKRFVHIGDTWALKDTEKPNQGAVISELNVIRPSMTCK